MAKKAASLRVHQVAKEIGVNSKDIIAKCEAEGIPDIVGHMSTVSQGLAATIREWFSAAGTSGTAIETAAPVDVEKARAKARKTTKRRSASSSEQSGVESGGDTAIAIAEPPTEVSPPQRAGRRAAARKTSTDSGDQAATDDAPLEIAPAVPIFRAPEPAPATPGKPAQPPPKTAPKPVMNVPERRSVLAPAGPRLEKPKQTKLAGPRVIRVEQPDILPQPRARGAGPDRPPGGGGRGSFGPPPTEAGGAGNRSDRGLPSRRNNRRRTGPGAAGAPATEGAGRTGRRSTFEAGDQPFNWREQDLVERENRLNRAGGFFKHARRDSLKRSVRGQPTTTPAKSGGKVKIVEPITIKELSAATGVKAADILKSLMLSGTMATINSAIDAASATELMLNYGIDLEVTESVTAEQAIQQQMRDRTTVDERSRSPVVTILGHVDHGKTSLLDAIRNTNVAAGEAGGITQATSAFRVPVHVGDNEHMITFIDTPGHEAFTEMRSRGAKVTDVVVLVVAADDGVMPQTIESINHAKAAGVPIIVALNKIDKPEATDNNIQRILGQLAEHELNPSEWGGSTEVVRVCALKKQGIQDLLDVLDYQSQLLDLKADFEGSADGTVLEAQLEEGRGPVARLLVQQGQLKQGDFIVIGRAYGRVRDIIDDRAQRIKQAGPGTPVAISGIDEVPDAGDKFYVVSSLRDAEAAAQERRVIERERSLASERITLDNIFQKMTDSGRKELPLIVKCDVQGSAETIKASLSKLTTKDVVVSVKHAAVGGINESDVGLAEASGAIILGFNVTTSAGARKLAEAKKVDIRFYDVIYDLIDDVTKAAEGLLDPEIKLEVLGHAEVREVFKISKVGLVAGCYITDGVVERDSKIRVTRGGIVIEKDRRLKQLKRFKDDAKEVRAGQECGMNIEGYDDIKPGDVLECYRTTEVRRSLRAS